MVAPTKGYAKMRRSVCSGLDNSRHPTPGRSGLATDFRPSCPNIPNCSTWRKMHQARFVQAVICSEHSRNSHCVHVGDPTNSNEFAYSATRIRRLANPPAHEPHFDLARRRKCRFSETAWAARLFVWPASHFAQAARQPRNKRTSRRANLRRPRRRSNCDHVTR